MQFVCAPMEADAQLGYFASAGLVDYVISVDGNICCFGAPAVLRPIGGRDFGHLLKG